MNRPKYPPSDPRHYQCPTCGQRDGDSCVNWRGRRCANHGAREALAREAAYAEAGQSTDAPHTDGAFQLELFTDPRGWPVNVPWEWIRRQPYPC